MLTKPIYDKVIDVWYGDMETSDPEILECYCSLLSPEEVLKMENLRNHRRRDQFTFVRGKLRTLLAGYTGERPAAIQFATGQYGKPFLPDYQQLAFNLSHSGNKFAFAVATCCDLGIDIECWKDSIGFTALVQRCFSGREQEYWQCLPEQDQTKTFFDFWTKKESFVKGAGRGLGIGLENCVCSTEESDRFESIPAEYGQAEEWMVFSLPLGTGISGAISVRATDYEIRMHRG